MSASYNDWESDLSSIIEKTNQNLKLLRRIGEKRTDDVSTTAPPMRSSTVNASSAPDLRTAAHHRYAAEDAAAAYRPRVLSSTAGVAGHSSSNSSTRKLADSRSARTANYDSDDLHSASARSVRRATPSKTLKTPSAAAPIRVHSADRPTDVPNYMLDEIRKSLEVMIVSRSSAFEKRMSDLRTDFTVLTNETTTLSHKFSDLRDAVSSKLSDVPGVFQSLREHADAVARLEKHSAALMGWKVSIDQDLMELVSKLKNMSTLQDKIVALEHNLDALATALKNRPRHDDRIAQLEDKLAALERQQTNCVDMKAVENLFTMRLPREVHDVESRLSQSIAFVAEKLEIKLLSVEKASVNQRFESLAALKSELMDDIQRVAAASLRKSDVAPLHHAHAQVRDDVAQLSSAVERSDKRVQDVKTVATSVRDELSETKQELTKALNAQQSRLSTLLDETVAQLRSASKDKHHKLEQQLVTLSKRQKRTDDAAKLMHDDVVKVRQDVVNKQTMSDSTQQRELETMRQRLARAAAELETLAHTKVEVERRFAKQEKLLQTKLRTLQTKLIESEKRNDAERLALLQRIQDETQRMGAAQGKNALLEALLAKEKVASADKSAQLLQMRQEIASVRQRMRSTESDADRKLQALATDLQTKQRDVDVLTKRLAQRDDDSAKQIEASKRDAALLRRATTMKEHELRVARLQLSEFERVVATLSPPREPVIQDAVPKSQLDDAESKRRAIERVLLDTQLQVDELRHEIDAMRTEHAAVSARSRAESDEQRTKLLTEYETQLTVLQDAVAAKDDAMDRLRATLVERSAFEALEAELSGLRGEKTALTASLDQLQSDHVHAMHEHDAVTTTQHQQAIDSVKRVLDAREAELEQAQTEWKRCKDAVTTLEHERNTQASTHADALATLVTELQAANARVADCERDVETLRIEKVELETELERLHDELDDVRANAVADSNELRDQLTAQATAMQQRLDALTQRLADKENELETSQRSNDTNRQQLQELVTRQEDAARQLQDEIETLQQTLENERASSKTRASNLEATIATLQSALATLEVDATAAATTLATTKASELAAVTRLLEDAQRREQQLQQRVASILQQITHAVDAFDAAVDPNDRSDNEEEEEEDAVAVRHLSHMQTTHRSVVLELERLQSELEATKQRTAADVATIRALEAQTTRSNDQVRELEAVVAQLEADLKRQFAQSAKHSDDFERDVAALKQQVMELQQDVAHKTNERKQTQSQLDHERDQSQRQMEALRHENATMTTTIASIQTKMARIEATKARELDTLAASVTALEAQTAALTATLDDSPSAAIDRNVFANHHEVVALAQSIRSLQLRLTQSVSVVNWNDLRASVFETEAQLERLVQEREHELLQVTSAEDEVLLNADFLQSVMTLRDSNDDVSSSGSDWMRKYVAAAPAMVERLQHLETRLQVVVTQQQSEYALATADRRPHDDDTRFASQQQQPRRLSDSVADDIDVLDESHDDDDMTSSCDAFDLETSMHDTDDSADDASDGLSESAALDETLIVTNDRADDDDMESTEQHYDNSQHIREALPIQSDANDDVIGSNVVDSSRSALTERMVADEDVHRDNRVDAASTIRTAELEHSHSDVESDIDEIDANDNVDNKQDDNKRNDFSTFDRAPADAVTTMSDAALPSYERAFNNVPVRLANELDDDSDEDAAMDNNEQSGDTTAPVNEHDDHDIGSAAEDEAICDDDDASAAAVGANTERSASDAIGSRSALIDSINDQNDDDDDELDVKNDMDDEFDEFDIDNKGEHDDDDSEFTSDDDAHVVAAASNDVQDDAARHKYEIATATTTEHERMSVRAHSDGNGNDMDIDANSDGSDVEALGSKGLQSLSNSPLDAVSFELERTNDDDDNGSDFQDDENDEIATSTADSIDVAYADDARNDADEADRARKQLLVAQSRPDDIDALRASFAAHERDDENVAALGRLQDDLHGDDDCASDDDSRASVANDIAQRQETVSSQEQSIVTPQTLASTPSATLYRTSNGESDDEIDDADDDDDDDDDTHKYEYEVDEDGADERNDVNYNEQQQQQQQQLDASARDSVRLEATHSDDDAALDISIDSDAEADESSFDADDAQADSAAQSGVAQDDDVSTTDRFSDASTHDTTATATAATATAMRSHRDEPAHDADALERRQSASDDAIDSATINSSAAALSELRSTRDDHSRYDDDDNEDDVRNGDEDEDELTASFDDENEDDSSRFSESRDDAIGDAYSDAHSERSHDDSSDNERDDGQETDDNALDASFDDASIDGNRTERAFDALERTQAAPVSTARSDVRGLTTASASTTDARSDPSMMHRHFFSQNDDVDDDCDFDEQHEPLGFVTLQQQQQQQQQQRRMDDTVGRIDDNDDAGGGSRSGDENIDSDSDNDVHEDAGDANDESMDDVHYNDECDDDDNDNERFITSHFAANDVEQQALRTHNDRHDVHDHESDDNDHNDIDVGNHADVTTVDHANESAAIDSDVAAASVLRSTDDIDSRFDGDDEIDDNDSGDELTASFDDDRNNAEHDSDSADLSKKLHSNHDDRSQFDDDDDGDEDELTASFDDEDEDDNVRRRESGGAEIDDAHSDAHSERSHDDSSATERDDGQTTNHDALDASFDDSSIDDDKTQNSLDHGHESENDDNEIDVQRSISRTDVATADDKSGKENDYRGHDESGATHTTASRASQLSGFATAATTAASAHARDENEPFDRVEDVDHDSDDNDSDTDVLNNQPTIASQRQIESTLPPAAPTRLLSTLAPMTRLGGSDAGALQKALSAATRTFDDDADDDMDEVERLGGAQLYSRTRIVAAPSTTFSNASSAKRRAALDDGDDDDEFGDRSDGGDDSESISNNENDDAFGDDDALDDHEEHDLASSPHDEHDESFDNAHDSGHGNVLHGDCNDFSDVESVSGDSAFDCTRRQERRLDKLEALASSIGGRHEDDVQERDSNIDDDDELIDSGDDDMDAIDSSFDNDDNDRNDAVLQQTNAATHLRSAPMDSNAASDTSTRLPHADFDIVRHRESLEEDDDMDDMERLLLEQTAMRQQQQQKQQHPKHAVAASSDAVGAARLGTSSHAAPFDHDDQDVNDGGNSDRDIDESNDDNGDIDALDDDSIDADRLQTLDVDPSHLSHGAQRHNDDDVSNSDIDDEDDRERRDFESDASFDDPMQLTAEAHDDTQISGRRMDSETTRSTSIEDHDDDSNDDDSMDALDVIRSRTQQSQQQQRSLAPARRMDDLGAVSDSSDSGNESERERPRFETAPLAQLRSLALLGLGSSRLAGINRNYDQRSGLGSHHSNDDDDDDDMDEVERLLLERTAMKQSQPLPRQQTNAPATSRNDHHSAFVGNDNDDEFGESSYEAAGHRQSSNTFGTHTAQYERNDDHNDSAGGDIDNVSDFDDNDMDSASDDDRDDRLDLHLHQQASSSSPVLLRSGNSSPNAVTRIPIFNGSNLVERVATDAIPSMLAPPLPHVGVDAALTREIEQHLAGEDDDDVDHDIDNGEDEYLEESFDLEESLQDDDSDSHD